MHEDDVVVYIAVRLFITQPPIVAVGHGWVDNQPLAWTVVYIYVYIYNIYIIYIIYIYGYRPSAADPPGGGGAEGGLDLFRAPNS